MFEVIELLGIVSFSISGALTAMSRKLDPFGVFIIAFVTAAGGGTLRDIMIGHTPVLWMRQPEFVFLIVLGFILSIIFHKQLDKLRVSLLLFDTIGLGVFTLIGLEKGLLIGFHPVICIMLGTISASFGGVIRDILCNEIPVIFRREIYATVCIAGGIVFFILKQISLQDDIIYPLTALFMIIFRLLAITKKWRINPIVK